ncbi:MAG: hypothetical protein COW73_04885 [Nitrospirae bacterium CG18_big_fil_WC_8_21_14_2_50_70_55]|nr:hypothetical protein [Deltaproteobacteria bacterium]OIP66585.1 MAG: hypothetical protein AUK30_02170 [Nitrospirae bacterium CG2_30_70_394]PIQ05667.1 MAG: hypothetical protein COW73_04885 [Nitrospirae bacterium CG18_big_fil_WC_8_21_14_2_50_70_55]PIU77243.1 MAG: hypothetical protein COS73_11600 [Nitrospirae bacterium CG06_land_8_20_14_3_00_70_43]PIW82732.1 MAG: hypothetical protein COZ96_07160 [Nitrospirae bacterium CG_4_8_14_3_um_filter_70_85]PIX82551.1 MAG: hypothetical protein COZ33_10070 
MQPVGAGPTLPASTMPAEAGRPAATGDSPAALHRAAQQFEALFLEMVLKAGHSTDSGNGLFGHSNGEQIFTDLRDSQFANLSAERGGLGIAALVERQWAQRLAPGVVATAPIHDMQGGQDE